MGGNEKSRTIKKFISRDGLKFDCITFVISSLVIRMLDIFLYCRIIYFALISKMFVKRQACSKYVLPFLRRELEYENIELGKLIFHW